jgi:protocatechuate 3,4-dioxygenase beta subunit
LTRTAICTASALVLLCGACGALGAEVTVVVADDAGQPMARARVLLRGATGITSLSRVNGVTDRTGTARLSDVAPASYSLTVVAPDYVRDRREVTVPPDAPLRVEVRLSRAGRVEGRITLRSGEPLANARVRLYFVQPGGYRGVNSIRVGPDGAYSVVWYYDTGRGTLVLKAPGYAAVERRDVELQPARDLTGMDFVLDAPAGAINGVVYQPDGRTPHANAVVCAEAIEGPMWLTPSVPSYLHMVGQDASEVKDQPGGVVTGTDGTFTLADLVAGTYRLYAYAPGYARSVNEQGVVVARSQRVAGVRIALEPGASMAGRVYGTRDEALGRARLSLTARHSDTGASTSVRITTDQQGAYRLDSLPPGPYRFEMSRMDGARAVQQVTLAEGEAAAGIDFRFRKGSTLTVLVVGPDGKPAGDAAVGLWEEAGGRYSRRGSSGAAALDGRIQFRDLFDGTYWVTVASPGAAPENAGPINVASGAQVPELTVTLREGAVIRGRAVDERGTPVTGASIQAYSYAASAGPRMRSGGQSAAVTDAEGRFALAHAAPGRWTVTGREPSHLAGTARLDVQDEGEYEADITMPRAWSGTLEGQILMPDEQTPAANTAFTVQLLGGRDDTRRPTGSTTRIRTDAEGRFSFVVKEGIHGAKFVGAGLTPASIDIEAEDRDELSVTVQLAPETGIHGGVLTADAEIPPDGLHVFAVPPGEYAYLSGSNQARPRPGQGAATVMPGETDWQILGLEPGDYAIFTYAPGLAPSVPTPVTVAEGEIVDTMVDVAVPGAVAGQVLTAAGEPVEGISVRATASGGRVSGVSLSGTTDAGGRYRIEGLTPGQVTLSISARARGYAVPPPQDTLVVPLGTIENQDFELLVGGEVSGIVRRRDGKPLTGSYRVYLLIGATRPLVAYPSGEGTFRIEHVHPGTYDVSLYRRDGDRQLLATHERIIVPDGVTVEDIEFVIDE